MKSIDEIKNELKLILSEYRYNHSIGTMEKAIEFAKVYGEDEGKCAYTALVHDIAKEMTIEEYYKYAKENGIEFSQDDKMCENVLHGIIGAHIAKNKYGFTEDMCRAIYYHTTGITNMTLFEKIIFLADKVEERTRTYDKAENLRNIIKEEGMDQAILFIADDYTIPKSIKNKSVIHPNTILLRNEIITKLKNK